MSEINNVSSGSSDNVFTSSAYDTLGKDDFLQLLVTKMTHQDPLEPLKDEAFVAELAQFSTLEQSYNMNSLLEEAINLDYLQMQTINNTMATNLIGKDIRASYSSIYLGESGMPNINFSNDEYAATVKITISDSSGNVIRTLDAKNVAAGENAITWNGRDENGERVDADVYTIEISATNANGESFKPSTFIQGRVDGIVYREGAALLKVNGMEIGLANVEEILEEGEGGKSSENEIEILRSGEVDSDDHGSWSQG